jgi:hypothetical protein
MDIVTENVGAKTHLIASTCSLSLLIARLKERRFISPLLLFLALWVSNPAFSANLSRSDIEAQRATDKVDVIEPYWGKLALFYVGDDYSMYHNILRGKIGNKYRRLQIIAFTTVGYDEQIVKLSENNNQHMDEVFAQGLVDIVLNNIGLDTSAINGVEINIYARGYKRETSIGRIPDSPIVSSGGAVVDGKLARPMFVGNQPLTVKAVLEQDRRETVALEKDWEQREAEKKRLAQERAQKKREMERRMSAAAAARKGPAIPAESPPAPDDIADAYMTELLAYGGVLTDRHSLEYNKGRSGGWSVSKVAVRRCVPEQRGFRCDYAMTQELSVPPGAQVFAGIFGAKVPTEETLDRRDLFFKTTNGWNSPTISMELRENKRRKDRERLDRVQRDWQETQQRWQEESLGL